MMRIAAITAVFALGAAGCAASPPPVKPHQVCGAERPVAAGGERATLWIRTSAEFRAATEIIYRSATAALAPALADRGWSAEPSQTADFADLPPAVVMDIDDTVLDNSAVQVRLSLERTCPQEFAPVWDAWVRERAAPAVPGAVAFLRAARALHDAQGRPLRVFLITNRECAPREDSGSRCPQQDDTLANLRALGLDAPTLADDLMLKGEQPDWGSEKLSRRRVVASNYRILLNVGDDLTDFIPGVRALAPGAREQARCARQDWWGLRWFVIPNPMYGSWLRVLGDDPGAALALPPAEACKTPD